jgi:leader peptidase (prepilin peptidase) / N-methyltransferase
VLFLAIAGSLTALTFAGHGVTLRAWAVLPVVVALAAVVVIDARLKLVPDAITLPGLVYTLALALVIDGRGVGATLAGLAVGGGLPLLMAVISRGGIGGGDIKLLAMLGPALGWKGVLGTFIASQFVALLVVLAVSVARRRLARDPVAVGAIIAALAALLLATDAPHP